MAENIILNFEADLSGLTPAINLLEKIGQIDKTSADQYRKDTAAVKERNKALEANQKTIQGTAKTVEDLSNKLKATPKTLVDKAALDAVDKTMKGISDTTTKQANSIRSLSLEYRKLLSDANAAGGAQTKASRDALKAAGELQDKIGDLHAASRTFASDTGAFDAVEKTTKGNSDTTTKQANSIRSLSLEYRKLLSDANAAGGAQTKAGRDALKAAGELQDKIGDIRAASRTFASDTGAFDAMLQGITTIGSAYQVATGAAQLFGSENEDLQKAFVKLQAIMAITTGLQQIQNALQKESAFSLRILTPLQNAWTAAMGASTGAMRVLRAALVSTGIGALVVGLGLVIERLMSFSAETDEAKKSQDGLNESVKSGEQILEDYNKRLQEQLGQSEAQKIREQNDLIKQATDLLDETFAKRKSIQDQYRNDIIFDQNQQRYIFTQERNIYDKRNIDLTVALNTLNALYEKERNIRERIGEIREELNRKQNEQTTKTETASPRTADVTLIEQREEDMRSYLLWYIEQTRNAYMTEAEIAMQYDLEKRKAIQAEDEKQYQRKLELERQLNEAIKNNAINVAQDISNTLFTIIANQNNDVTNNRLASLDAQKEKELSGKRVTEKQKREIEEKYEKEQAKIKNKAAEEQRKAEIAQAIINGSLAVTNILANMVDPTVTQTFKTIAIGASIVSTALQIARIQSQPIPKYATGTKYVAGQGTETSDSVPAMLSVGERVVSSRTNRKYKPILDAIHDNIISPDILNSLALNMQYTGIGNNRVHVLSNKIEFDYNKFAEVMSARDYKNRYIGSGKQPINVIVQPQPLRGR